MIRPARPGDIPGVLAIWNPIIRDTLITFTPDEKAPQDMAELLRSRAAAGQPFLVAEEDGQVAGFVTYGPFRGGAGYRHSAEHTILLAPVARGRGLGRALMAAMEEHARAQGIHAMIGGVSAANPKGVAFHAAIGYAEVARVPQVGRKAGRWLDLVLMQKILS